MTVKKYSMEVEGEVDIEAGGEIAGQKYESKRTDSCIEVWQQWKQEEWLYRNTENRRRDVCTEIGKKGWLYRNMEAGGGTAVLKYGSRRREGCTEIWKQEKWLYRNMEAGGEIAV